MSQRRVVVIGGGLAGITAAIGLRDAGVAVTLLESRPRLGGAASSYARAGMMIDNGQHVFLGCCSSYQGLLARLGVTDQVAIQDRFDVTVLSGTGAGPARLRRNGLPSPLHLAGALAGYPLLSLAERARVGRAALAFLFADPASPALDRQRLGDWLATRGQDERARRRLWDLFIISALNIGGDDASAGLAATVIKTALLGRRDAADIGMATVPQGQLHAEATADLLARLGAEVRLGARASGIERLAGGGFRVSLSRGEDATEEISVTGTRTTERATGAGQSIVADGVVLAVPPAQAARLASSAGVTTAPAWDQLGSSPIVNIHLIYDRQVMKLPFVAAVDSPVQWVFDKTRQSGLQAGQYLAVSLSAADDYVDMPVAALRELFVPALEELFPAAAGAGITDFFVTRERRATFRQAPGSGVLRPGAATSVPGLVLAGAWTNTGWPDTMEGAVRSGHNAAQELAGELTSLPSAERAANVGSTEWSGVS
ncbi:MAG TPA: hydroxysqualene dehydroxylase HpnE [Streptosporangiaceae bacterium]|nr:hydroxysqualene dehydroxylase HpnE [Streptosporangiaceae bacterium]